MRYFVINTIKALCNKIYHQQFFLLFKALSIALSNLCVVAFTVEFILKPYCSSASMLLSKRYRYILAYISFSNIFEKDVSNDRGL